MTQAEKQAAAELAVQQPEETFTLTPRDIGQAMEFSKLIASSNLAPPAYKGKPADVLIAVQIGAELGVQPMQALQNVAVINGRPCIWGDLGRALLLRSGLLEDQSEIFDESTQTARAVLKRKGIGEPFVGEFSMADAERAKLAGKDTYRSYPRDMLGWRAWWRAARKGFSDVLKGVQSREEAEEFVETSPGQSVSMPRRASETRPADVAAFIGGDAPKPAAKSRKAAPPEDTWTGTLVETSEKSGETNGKPWTYYTIRGDDGTEFSTFSATLRAGVEEMLGQPVEVRWAATPKGGRKILGVNPADPPEPGE